jgi:hypothetical protein
MKKAGLIGQYILIAAGALLLPSANVFANPETPPSGGTAEYRQDFDWVKHTQQTLDDLKGKLNLTPAQMPAWETWSAGLITDAHQQPGKDNPGHEGKGSAAKPMVDETTPEKMAHGIERLHAQITWMQAHVARLEAAQVRTKTFYDTLSTDQKTIFDLFWNGMHRKMHGYGGWGTHMPMSSPMMEENQSRTRKE